MDTDLARGGGPLLAPEFHSLEGALKVTALSSDEMDLGQGAQSCAKPAT